MPKILSPPPFLVLKRVFWESNPCCCPLSRPLLKFELRKKGGAADRLQISTIQTDYKIFGRWMWPTIQIAYKNSTIHIAYTSPLYRSTTVPHGQWVECNQTEYAPYFKKYPEHSFPNKEYFFAFKIYTHIFLPDYVFFLIPSFSM